MDDPTNPNPQHEPYPHHQPVQPNPQPRRPRGFAATSSSLADPNSNPSATTKLTSTKREREKEKERTKLRERHRRAITSRMLAGLRQYGNFPLPARADMNDVLAALAREAGWTVEPDGTTYRQSHHPIAPPSTIPHHSSQIGATSFGVSMPGSGNLKSCTTLPKDCGLPSSSATSASFLRVDENLSPAASLCGDSLVIDAASQRNDGNFVGGSSPININPVVECLDADQFIHNVHSVEQGNGFIGTPYIPVYVTLATGFINNFCQLVNPQGVREELSHLASLVDGVLVDCWWGIVEAWSPQNYVWSGYRELFNIMREFKLKLQVVMAFHEHGGNDVGGAFISLPQWVLEIGKEDHDIYFTDREGRRNTEYLSWSIDKQRVLKGRTGIEVYSDFMRSFRTEFDDLFADGLISAVEIGLGPSGELRYPSFSERMGWSFPGIGEFQCYDKYFQQSLRKSAKMRGHLFWGKVPDNAGDYCSRPNETGFFCDRGEYDSYYGRFFLQWYAQSLVDHAENVLSLASLAFEDTNIVVKIPAVHWWYKTASHAAELMAGYYNSSNRDGYCSVFEALKKYSVTVKLVCSGLPVTGHDVDAFSDPEGLSWQVLNAAWERGLSVAGVNELSCYDRERCLRVVEMLKPRNDPDHHSFSFFVYQQPSLLVQGYTCFPDFCHFIKCMRGEVSDDLLS